MPVTGLSGGVMRRDQPAVDKMLWITGDVGS